MIIRVLLLLIIFNISLSETAAASQISTHEYYQVELKTRFHKIQAKTSVETDELLYLRVKSENKLYEMSDEIKRKLYGANLNSITFQLIPLEYEGSITYRNQLKFEYKGEETCLNRSEDQISYYSPRRKVRILFAWGLEEVPKIYFDEENCTAK